MAKTRNVQAVQAKARQLIKEMVGKRFKHHKGDFYVCTAVTVDEATLALRVDYKSEKTGFVWSRTLANFTDTVPRFSIAEEK